MTAAAHLCWDYEARPVDLSNCLAVHALATDYHNPGLADTVLAFVHLYFQQVAQSQEFLQMDAQQLTAVLASDSVDVVSEDEVWEAVLRWLDHDCPARLEHVSPLLQVVRAACLSEPCRQEYALILRSAPTGTPQCAMELVGGTTQIAKPRHSVGAQEVILCLGGTYEEPFVEEEARVDVFCPSIPAVWRLKDLPDLVECCSAVLLDPGCIMINSMNCIGTVQRNSHYTGLRDEWRAIEGILPEHQEPLRESPLRQAGALAALNGRVYAAGGFDPFAYGGVKALASVDAYDPRSDSWGAVAALPVGLMGMAMVACEGRLYAFGGEDTEDVSNAAFSYDPAANAWIRLADMPTARSGCRAYVAPDGLIYVTGGETGTTARRVHVEAYDRVTNQWHRKGDLVVERSEHECVCVGGRLYAIGGIFTEGVYHDSIEVYDEETDSWALHKCRLLQPKFGFGCVVMKLKQPRTTAGRL
ncbi:kelch-like protein 10 [Paramacrobiotus metropolitanus]|uniref:kelch-like protein 10 n=1 Tax=Paramacrobiotus metropolitanus TaxID=2943436 RepID=UPI002445854F|nr:kelch-like protein 10 [Paramacrobiotus metropolitanus]